MRKNQFSLLAVMILLCFGWMGKPLLSQSIPVNEYSYPQHITRPWIGPDFWANRLQDWQVNVGRIECLEGEKPMRTLHLLTSELSERTAPFEISVRTGILGFNYAEEGDSWTGFLIGAGHNGIGYQAASLIHHFGGEGGGIIACLEENGGLRFRSNEQDDLPGEFPLLQSNTENTGMLERSSRSSNWEDLQLKLRGEPLNNGNYRLVLSLADHYSGKLIAKTTIPEIEAERIAGNVALVSHGGKTGTRYWFRDFKIAEDKFSHYPERRFGPILNCFYSINGSQLKLSAQFPPLGFGDTRDVKLAIKSNGRTVYEATTAINPKGWLALFEIDRFDPSKPYAYEVHYTLGGDQFVYHGKIKKDPVDKDETSVAAFTCYQVIARPADDSWGVGFAGMPEGRWTRQNLWFPHNALTNHVNQQDPDLLVFLGDQVYEGGNPTDSEHDEGNPTLDFLYKYFIFLWDMQGIAKDRPAILLTDDHDVYQGDLWGDGGTPSGSGANKAGGYVHEPQFVNTAEYVMTAHNPGLYDPSPVKQDIGVYYGSFNYGGISFAILEDRKFKSLPTVIGDFEKSGSKIVDPDFTIDDAEVEGVTLLGDRQLAFLNDWIDDWEGAEIKVAISQTAYTSMHTQPDGDVWKDMDSNGWPPSGRNRALDIIRRGHALLLGGDTHLPTVVHHGIKTHGDASYQFVVPAITNKYRRWWSPGRPELSDHPSFYGDHLDGFNNKITVKALGNPVISNKEVYNTNKALGRGYGSEHIFMDHTRTKDGYGIIRLDKAANKITMECWSSFPDESGKIYQHEGWPVVISPGDNFQLQEGAFLPKLILEKGANPVVNIWHEKSGELVHSFRLHDSYVPRVMKPGKYTIEALDAKYNKRIFKKVVASTESPQKQVFKIDASQ